MGAHLRHGLTRSLLWFRSHVSPAALAVILSALIVAYLLFIPPVNGYANNGDFDRAIYVNGLYRLTGKPYYFFTYMVQKYGIMQYFNESSAALFSSQPLFIKAAIGLNMLAYSTKVFDIRFMGLIYYVLFLGGIYLLTEALTFPSKRWRNYIIALMVVFVFADSSYTLYFNSFFAEPGMFVAILYSFSSILLLARHRFKRRWPMVLLFFISTVVLITNKQQNAPLALGFALTMLSLLFVFHKRAEKLYVILGTVLILASGVATYALITKTFNNINEYQSMTRGVLLKAKDPEKALMQGGIDSQFALTRGQTYFDRYSPIDVNGKYMQKHFTDKFSFMWILKYELTHPSEFGALLNLAAKDGQLTQVKAVSDYTKAAGQPKYAQTHYFTGFSTIMGAFFPRTFAFYVLIAFAFIGVYAFGAYHGIRDGDPEMVVRLALIIANMAIIFMTFIASVIGDGDADLAKHLFMVPLCTDLSLALLVSDLLNHRLWHVFEMRGGQR